MNTSLNKNNFELYDGDIGEVKYRLNVPGLPLSHYRQGCRIVLRPLRKRRLRYDPILVVIIVYALLALANMALSRFDITLFMTVFQETDDADFGFSHRWWGASVMVFFLYAALLGYFFAYFKFLRCSRRFQKKAHDYSRLAETNYCLELGEYGLRCQTKNGISCYRWDCVTNFTNHKGMSFISLFATSFLWIPDDLEGYDRDAVAAFIRRKLTRPI